MFRRAAALAPAVAGRAAVPRAALRRGRGLAARGAAARAGRRPSTPDRLPALEALARVRERQGRLADARGAAAADLRPAGAGAGGTGAARASWRWRPADTPAAIDAFERARRAQGGAFRHDLELGVLYLAARRFDDARDALDRVPPSHPEYPMALFKRAQVSVLLNEPDRAARIAARPARR